MSETTYHLWSAMPTPLTPDYELDAGSLERAVDWQAGLGIEGLFAAGSCGEGPFLRDAVLDELTRRTAALCKGRMRLSVQVTDHSADRVLDRIARAAEAGADMATLASPLYYVRATDRWLTAFYVKVLDESPLPVCLYQLPGPTLLPADRIADVYAHPNLRMLKDSTQDADRQALMFQVAARRPDLLVLSGVEIGYYADFIRGFHGGLLGSAILNGAWARAMHAAVAAGNHDLARAISDHIAVFLYEIFGGPPLKSWMGGLKYCLKQMGLFTHTTAYFDMPPDDATRARIDRLVAGRFWEADPARLEKGR